MSNTSKLISDLGLNVRADFTDDNLKDELYQILEAEKERISKIKRTFPKLSPQNDITYDYKPKEKYVTTENSINFSVLQNPIIKPLVIQPQIINLELSPIYEKQNNLESSKNIKNFNDNLITENCLNIEIIKVRKSVSDSNNYKYNCEKTEPSFDSRSNVSKGTNKLIQYLPKMHRNTLSPIGKKVNLNNSISNSYQSNDFNNELIQIDEEYESIKKDLIELNPILKMNHAFREQFFCNVSEGKLEKYTFIKNLYNIINNNAELNKPVFKKDNIVAKNIPHNKNYSINISNDKYQVNKGINGYKNNKNVINYKPVVNNFKGIKMLNKSASGSNLNKKVNGTNLNFLEGINISFK